MEPVSKLPLFLPAPRAADPTAVEAEVRRQMAEREAAHRDRNLANRLTPAERRAKKLRKVMGAPAPEGACHVAVFRVGDLSSPALRFKVEANAREARMSGVAIAGADFCLVVVEGGPKPQRRCAGRGPRRRWRRSGRGGQHGSWDIGTSFKQGWQGCLRGITEVTCADCTHCCPRCCRPRYCRYERLMLERINWAAAGAAEEEEDEGGEPKAPNYCRLVWQGVTPAPVFKKFRLEAVTGEVAARALLADHGVEHYWDVAKATNPE